MCVRRGGEFVCVRVCVRGGRGRSSANIARSLISRTAEVQVSKTSYEAIKNTRPLSPGPKIIKLFSCSTCLTEHEIFPAHKC